MSCLLQIIRFPDDGGIIENNFTLHQLLTTTNFFSEKQVLLLVHRRIEFSDRTSFVSEYMPYHYKRFLQLLKNCKWIRNPYNVHSNFYKAVKNHVIMLRDLGRYDDLSECYNKWSAILFHSELEFTIPWWLESYI